MEENTEREKPANPNKQPWIILSTHLKLFKFLEKYKNKNLISN